MKLAHPKLNSFFFMFPKNYYLGHSDNPLIDGSYPKEGYLSLWLRWDIEDIPENDSPSEMISIDSYKTRNWSCSDLDTDLTSLESSAMKAMSNGSFIEELCSE